MCAKYTIEYTENDQGNLLQLQIKEDMYQMNWVEGTHAWGSVIHPDEITVSVHRQLLENGRLQETYLFTNDSPFPVFLKETDLGIYTTFNDDYLHSGECMKNRCNTHFYCGKNVTWVQALRMGGKAPHLGLILTEGSIASYSIERNLQDRSNDRGDFIMHPDVYMLESGESAVIRWELFPFSSSDDFQKIVFEHEGFPFVQLEHATYFRNEAVQFQVIISGSFDPELFRMNCSDMELTSTVTKNGTYTIAEVHASADRCGEHQIDISYGKNTSIVKLFVSPALDDVLKNRMYYIAQKQQFHKPGSPLDGAYLIYDKETDRMYYSHLDDHNGGRERVAMGVVMACYLQDHEDAFLENSLQQYLSYIYRELYDENTGMVYNDIHRNNDWDRLYNYPWFSDLFHEVYRLYKNKKYLKDAYMAMKQYYAHAGEKFYAISMTTAQLWQDLRDENMIEEADDIRNKMILHADVIMGNGTNYPESEVQYEQSIVSPAAGILLNTYMITGDAKYLTAAKEQLDILYLFNARQPEYHQFENAVRHWDGYWFGKRRNYGDCYPHYWSALTGVDFALYAQQTHEAAAADIACNSIRGCLNLFDADGFGSCAMVFPETVSSKKGNYYDPWANDQDWALYYAWKYREYIEPKGADK